MNRTKLIALKRISKDIQEITNNPVEGIGIIQYEDDNYKYIVNIKLMYGIYKDFCLQLLLTFSDLYPTKPPKILLFPSQNFDETYHHHIFSDSGGFYKFCFDLLENDFMNTDSEKSGWNPSYTISSLLIQVQNFLCEPDLNHEIPKYHIDNFFILMKTYSREFKDADGKIVKHTWENPYPKMYFKEEEKDNKNEKGKKRKKKEIKEEKEEEDKKEDDKNNNEENEDSSDTNKKPKTIEEITNELQEIEKNREQGYKVNKKKKARLKKRLEKLKQKEKEEEYIKEEKRKLEEKLKKEEENRKRLIEIKENLTCFMLKLNYIEDPDILLGYPIIQKKTGKGLKTKIELYPIPELLTYDGFMSQIGKNDEKLDFYFSMSFKSANNEFYNYWVPIYIDKNHFEKNKQTILNSFSIIKFGAIGIKEYDFKTNYIFEILPIILNKMIIEIFKKITSLSEAFVRCYFQYILLLKKLTEIYKKELDAYIKTILDKIKNNYNHIDKKIIPDIGNFVVLLIFSNFEITDELWKCMMDESSIR
jgi:ubiquitin-protein ligase